MEKYFLVANAICCVSAFLFLARKVKLDLKKFPICKLGSIKQTALLFNTFLALFSTGQIIIVTKLIIAANFLGTIALFGLIISSTAGLMAAFITMNRNLSLHTLLARIAFSVTFISGAFYAVSLFPNTTLVPNLLITLVLSSVSVSYLQTNKITATSELVFFVGLIFWDAINLMSLRV